MSFLIWPAFLVLFLAILALDLGVLHRESRSLKVRQALAWTVVWIAVAAAFAGIVYGLYEYHWLGWRTDAEDVDGTDAAVQYLTGYVLEWSLSVDNIFVMAVIFTFMRITQELQYRVLFWGIVGAIVLRGAMIAMGSALIARFDWMFYVFGAILIVSAARMLRQEGEFDPSKSLMVRFVRKLFPIADRLDGARFFTRVAGGTLAATPLFMTLILIDVADVVFAVDSIPAIFAVTQDPFLVFSSNAFAILGLRSLYFAVAGLMALFEYLRVSLVFVLAFVGVKMMLHRHFPISNVISLAVIAALLAVGIVASLAKRRLTRARNDDGTG
jgi:tellurite resistance protein TerC